METSSVEDMRLDAALLVVEVAYLGCGVNPIILSQLVGIYWDFPTQGSPFQRTGLGGPLFWGLCSGGIWSPA